ncbi:transglycosylase domain-containing protein [Agreia sp. COWG]|uniref:transglycosylase domain-containing protein n=1 Tax=Agreia sp. COWG TaxID=2773266 RepID=UPI001927987E|nr:transglycosylase domain-containing protein [Agreia sp. COWG]CAD6002283.1 Multimodular transpeptidase-transglycosylase [Agreia sp. COWG]
MPDSSSRPFTTAKPWLHLLGVSVIAGILVTALAVPAVSLTSATVSRSVGLFEDLPSTLDIGALSQKSEIYSTNSDGTNTLLATVFDQNRQEVGWDEIAPAVKDALVSTEDPRFYEHNGVDLASTARAALSNLTSGGVESGASTITMQYVKNVLVQRAEALDDETAREKAYAEATQESLDRKLAEMRLAIGLEKKYTKDQILLGYLNIANFGGSVYGIEAAANYYFGTTAAQLTVPQAASLIATVNEPNGLRIDDPANIPDNEARRNVDVLASMLKHHTITQSEYDAAIATPVTPVITEPSTGCQTAANGAAYFCDYVTWIVKNDPTFGATADERWTNFKTGGFQIFTTLNSALQANANETMQKYVPSSSDELDLGSTIVTVEPGTGRILAMAQNTTYVAGPSDDPGSTSLNYNTDQGYGGSTGFQVGSTYKVFTLAEWLKQGHSLSERVNGNPQTFKRANFTNTCADVGGPDYSPSNDSGERPGTVSVQTALTDSVNNAFVAMAQKLDLCQIRNTAQALGVHRADGATLGSDLADVIGTQTIAPLTMAAAYAGIAANGNYCAPIAIDKILDASGAELQAPKADCAQALDPKVAATVAYAMKGPIQSGTATASNPNDDIEHIGKTGTTDNEKDTWMIGASTKAATAVWVGNVSGDVSMTDVETNGYSGYSVRHRIWKAVMTANDEVLPQAADFPDPDRTMVNGSGSRSNSDSSTSTPTPTATPTPSAPPSDPVDTPAPDATTSPTPAAGNTLGINPLTGQ